MINLSPFLSISLHTLIYFKYFFIFLGTIIEGPIIMVASGFLLHLGYFKVVPLYIAIVLGDLTGDILWYYIGYFYGESFIKKHGKFFGLTIEKFEKVKSIFSRHYVKIMFFSKLVAGFGFIIYFLMAAGASKVKIKTYLIVNFLGELCFVAMLLSIGYSFGKLYNYFNKGFKGASLVVFLPILILIYHGVKKYISKKFFATKY